MGHTVALGAESQVPGAGDCNGFSLAIEGHYFVVIWDLDFGNHVVLILKNKLWDICSSRWRYQIFRQQFWVQKQGSKVQQAVMGARDNSVRTGLFQVSEAGVCVVLEETVMDSELHMNTGVRVNAGSQYARTQLQESAADPSLVVKPTTKRQPKYLHNSIGLEACINLLQGQIWVHALGVLFLFLLFWL